MTDDQIKSAIGNKVVESTEVTPGPWSWPSIAQFGRGLLYAVIAATLPIVWASFIALAKGNPLVIPWNIVEGTGVSTALAYLMAKIPQAQQQITTFKKP